MNLNYGLNSIGCFCKIVKSNRPCKHLNLSFQFETIIEHLNTCAICTYILIYDHLESETVQRNAGE